MHPSSRSPQSGQNFPLLSSPQLPHWRFAFSSLRGAAGEDKGGVCALELPTVVSERLSLGNDAMLGERKDCGRRL